MNEISIFWLFAPILLCGLITIIGVAVELRRDQTGQSNE